MTTPITLTKLNIPHCRTKLVTRPRLMTILNEGLERKLTLISASAGYGKTTLVSEWINHSPYPAAWLSLDEQDHNPIRLLTYFIRALQTVEPKFGDHLIDRLTSSQPIPNHLWMTTLLNELTTITSPFVLILDDYHLIDTEPVNDMITLLIEHMPQTMHLYILTRTQPNLALSRLRVRHQLTEIRPPSLQFTSAETDDFLHQVMDLNLSLENRMVLHSHTEGWVAGLQLAALSIQGSLDPNPSLQQSEQVQTFLLQTSIVERLCGSLCDALTSHNFASTDQQSSTLSGQETLEYLEQINLFIIPLDQERRWYRYHHLFADVLRKKLQPHISTLDNKDVYMAELHHRASQWFEEHHFEEKAFHHAALSGNIDRAAYLMDGNGMPFIFRGILTPVLEWLDTLSDLELNTRPSLWVTYAAALLISGHISNIEPKLQAAESLLKKTTHEQHTRDLIGHIASIRATIAVSKHDPEVIIAESLRALHYSSPINLPIRTAANWSLGYAYQLQGNRLDASKAYTEAIRSSQQINHHIITLLATLGLGNLQEADNLLLVASDTYQLVIEQAGYPPLPVTCEAYLGLARIQYEWNNLETALQHVEQAIQLARLLDQSDRVIAGEIWLAKIKLAQGDCSSAATLLAQCEHIAKQHQFIHQLPDLASVQVLVLIRQSNELAATFLAKKFNLTQDIARIYLSKNEPTAALILLEPLFEQAQGAQHQDKLLLIMLQQSVAYYSLGDKRHAMQLLKDSLYHTESHGFIRTFIELGKPMFQLLQETANVGLMPSYVQQILVHFDTTYTAHHTYSLIEPLSSREIEVLRLISEGQSNQEISEKLYIALATVKEHNRVIFDKLQVKRRTEAVARARELGFL
ncbi:LuxR C-terminal-related transcriptional regulator [Paenibacillus sp. N1-5-1-14]|uniref:LuxR C-terminal-related transcriptional regulator n=1 Tax=Paenibacillus radicibacter TaxID=2972488 RepID=UPI00215930B5|nr:LuxR C-terminal-related transcriptional regulator [Paenibacillus radicibacter]MCR8643810.1 LuxR C-terminal-related transcriptional regulator [Paenibacillus radicibacter]